MSPTGTSSDEERTRTASASGTHQQAQAGQAPAVGSRGQSLVVSPREPIVVDDLRDLDVLPARIEAPEGATFVVPDFALLEELVERGVDSSMIAVVHGEADPNWLQATLRRRPGAPIVPPAPYDFGARILVVVPTYNERENLEPLIEAIGRHLVADVLVVDDGSPDGTGEVADRLAAERANVHVLHRTQKQGIGRAYLAGFQWGFEHGAKHGSDYELMFEMDADFSHAPWDLPRFVPAIERADLVIGSRYVPGGDTTGWDAKRRALSKFGNGYARTFLGGGLSDMTAGYRCFRTAALKKLDFDAVTTDGYAFQIEMAHRIRKTGGSVREIPVHFVDRFAGNSKMSKAIAFEAMWKVPLLRFRR